MSHNDGDWRLRIAGILILVVLLILPGQSYAGTETERKLTRYILDRSLGLGRNFLLNNQKLEGNFNYEYNFMTKELTQDDHQVRQAGVLWSIALIHHDRPSRGAARAIERGLEFFGRNSRETRDGGKYPLYPGYWLERTGTVALLVLTLVDYLRSDWPIKNRSRYEEDLDKYIKFLVSLRKGNGQFHQYHIFGKGVGPPSPYYDGESLLAMVKAAKYAGREDLREIILESAEAMHKRNVEDALEENPDSDVTKGFYQWGSMAYYEIYTAGWEGTEKYAKRVINLAYWMIDVHRTLERTRNTSYAHEGLVSAWELARLTNNKAAMKKIVDVVDTGLYKLTSWQVGSPVENDFLKKHRTRDLKAIGGVMNGKADPRLRIDVTQHQMHAVLLARRFIYKR